MTDTMLLWHTREFSLLLQGRHHATCGNMPLPARWVVFFHRFWRGLERFLGKLCSFSATLEIHSMICVAWKSILTHMLCIYVQKCEFNRTKHTQNKWKYIDWYGSPNRPCPLLIQLAVVNDHWMHRKAVWERAGSSFLCQMRRDVFAFWTVRFELMSRWFFTHEKIYGPWFMTHKFEIALILDVCIPTSWLIHRSGTYRWTTSMAMGEWRWLLPLRDPLSILDFG